MNPWPTGFPSFLRTPERNLLFRNKCLLEIKKKNQFTIKIEFNKIIS